ncbi:MAG: UDP-N-acetylmuramate--L-alanine ligase [Flavobacteriaceae bacterium]|jgi:UDP-N-acetylmuramate--alanine ligase|nr:UDP-N-acetylmuramate--L-alanine ligase [Flavobacteriaceae bacterium]MBT6128395.1 UDP-N-acetylmuramate--L-alanine ligase [Flavobacteriaceae bacterium]MDG1028508.1 UDP-N-acetylmuramate--L-alanine ligase [Flavobacteriaceae bacterium]MDG1941603.1 UDP-N-acetylmuramate--L-alanine ligase [Flavobacteriaceae bacterium]
MNRKGNKYYFLGIGGIGMSALAKYLFDGGNRVMGYDKTSSPITSQLINLGIDVLFDASVTALPEEYRQENTQIVYTPAVPQDHPQLRFFIDQGNQIKKRAAVLGEITKDTVLFAIAGTHGKTTTASFLTHYFAHLNLEFTAFLGGIMNEYQSNLIQKGKRYSIVEADEYDRSFLQLFPDYACITAMDADHLDVYGNHENMKKAFEQFSERVKHKVVVAQGVEMEACRYAVEEKADYYAQSIRVEGSGYRFDLVSPTQTHKDVYLKAMGRHNLSNAIGALAVLDRGGLPLEKALASLGTFKGIHRRMEVFSLENKTVVDDYAHHPEEINAVLKTISEFYPDKHNMVVFQPHLFSRTQDFMEEFVEVLSQFDEIVLMDIYPAREEPIAGVSSDVLLGMIQHQNKRKISDEDFRTTIVNSKADLVLVLGAGDIGNHIQKLKKTA